MDNVNRNNMTPEQIADLETDAKAEGYEIDWNPDGSLVIIEDGSAISIEPTDPEDLAYREENAGNQTTDEDLQKQLEEAQKQLEGMELPEGYEDMLGDIDLESLLQGMQ